MNYSIYIYYNVAPDSVGKLGAAVRVLFKGMARQTGIEGRLLSRRDKPETWMEVYEGVANPDAFQSSLDSELERLHFAELLGPDSRRITELFTPL